MRSLRESILRSNNASVDLDGKLSEFKTWAAYHIFETDATYEYFCKWLDEDKFKDLCIRCLQSTRKKTSKFDNNDFMNIVLKDRVLLFIFYKSDRNIFFIPALTNQKVFSVHASPSLINNSISPTRQPMHVNIDKQIEQFYEYFVKNKDEVVKHKYDVV